MPPLLSPGLFDQKIITYWTPPRVTTEIPGTAYGTADKLGVIHPGEIT